jgi:hypothetical protein
MNKQRRIFIITASLLLGTFFAFLLVRSRMGTLKPNDWFQLGFNFLFALAIVIGIGIVLKRMRDKDEDK